MDGWDGKTGNGEPVGKEKEKERAREWGKRVVPGRRGTANRSMTARSVGRSVGKPKQRSVIRAPLPIARAIYGCLTVHVLCRCA